MKYIIKYGSFAGPNCMVLAMNQSKTKHHSYHQTPDNSCDNL